MNLTNLKIWSSPITNTIYAGYTNKDGTEAKVKIDVTDQIRRAVMQHFHQSAGQYWTCPVGELRFFPKNNEVSKGND